MSAKVESIGVMESESRTSVGPRIVSLFALLALVAGLALLVRSAYLAFTDSWVAPITLTPDNDAVVQINVRLNEQIVQRAKLRSDIDRIDVDVKGVDSAIARLGDIRENGQKAMQWAARSSRQQVSSARTVMSSLDRQRAVLNEMSRRQEGVVLQAKKNAAAGLISAPEEQREVQALSQLWVAIAANEKQRTEVRLQQLQFGLAASALSEAPGRRGGAALLPEVAAGEDRDVRIELEIIRLQSERRALVDQREIASESLTRMDEILRQLRSRPLYRAVEASTDVAFIPYTQLKGVTADATLLTCTWALFNCRVVGRVKEVLPGEVVAQDPWSEIARGQYAILELTDHDAAHEKVLRVRPIGH
ncbi:MAG: hypothetical protein KF894_22015 [Labilithrix sp.]|nr:hypothetical protein [Labilithrix sp.]